MIRIAAILALLTIAACGASPTEPIAKVSGALEATPFFCGYEMGSDNNLPDSEWTCNWTAPSGLPDWVQTYHGNAVLPFPGHALPCEGQTLLHPYQLIVTNASCPHTFVPVCSSVPTGFSPWSQSYPTTATSPTISVAQYSCAHYPDVNHFGPTNVAQYVSLCTAGQTPRGSIDLYLSSNVGNKSQANCARITPPLHDSSLYMLDFENFLANGWRTQVGSTTVSIQSVEMGPNTEMFISDNARVDLSSLWLCRFAPHCLHYNWTGSFSLELDHIASGLPGVWRPWSIMFGASY